jgi:hypothetical protein
MGNQRL